MNLILVETSSFSNNILADLELFPLLMRVRRGEKGG